MATIYSALKNNFSQVSNHALLDIRLSSKAKALYWYMCYRLGLSDKWEFNKNEILSHFKEGEKAMRPAFKELLEVGFLERRQARSQGGKFGNYDYTIHAEPVNKLSEPEGRNGHAVKRHAENGHAENAFYNKKDKINKDSNNKDLSLSKEKKSKGFIPPSLEEIKQYCMDNELHTNYEGFFKYYGPDWKDGQDKPIKNWKKKLIWWSSQPQNYKVLPEKHKKTLNDANSVSIQAQTESKDITQKKSDLRVKLNLMDHRHAELYFDFNSLEKSDAGYKISAKNPKAADYKEILDQLNIELQLNN